MSSFTMDQILVLIGYAGAILGVYVNMNTKIRALEIEVTQIRKDADAHRAESQKMDERVSRKFDTIIEKFEVVNDKINELILEFTKK